MADAAFIKSLVVDIQQGNNHALLEKLRAHPEAVNEKHENRALFNWACVSGNEEAVLAIAGMGGLFKGEDRTETHYILNAIASNGLENILSRDEWSGKINGYISSEKGQGHIDFSRIQNDMQQAGITVPDPADLQAHAKFCAAMSTARRLAQCASGGYPSYTDKNEDNMRNMFLELMKHSGNQHDAAWEQRITQPFTGDPEIRRTMEEMSSVMVQPEFLRQAGGELRLEAMHASTLKTTMTTQVVLPFLAKQGVVGAVDAIHNYDTHKAEIRREVRNTPPDWTCEHYSTVDVPREIVANEQGSSALKIVELSSARAMHHAFCAIGKLGQEGCDVPLKEPSIEPGPDGVSGTTWYSINDTRGAKPGDVGKPRAVFRVDRRTRSAHPDAPVLSHVEDHYHLHPPVLNAEGQIASEVQQAFDWYKDEHQRHADRAHDRDAKRSLPKVPNVGGLPYSPFLATDLPSIIHDMGFAPDQASNAAAFAVLKKYKVIPSSIATLPDLMREADVVAATLKALTTTLSGYDKPFYPDLEPKSMPEAKLRALQAGAEKWRHECEQGSGLDRDRGR